MAKELKTFTIEGTRILFPNFAGEGKRFNDAGKRNICVVIPDDMVDDLVRDGWNVKFLAPYEGDEDARPTPYLKVKISYAFKPPRIVMMTDTARTSLDEDSIEVLDYADIGSVDIICTGSDWEQPDGKFGTTAYLKTLFVKIAEDELERKYAINSPRHEAD